MKRSDIPLGPRTGRVIRSRSAMHGPGRKVTMGFHARQRPAWFDGRGEDKQGRIRALILRRELKATVEPLVRMRMRDRLGRPPTRKELRVVMEREYRAAKKAAKAA